MEELVALRQAVFGELRVVSTFEFLNSTYAKHTLNNAHLSVGDSIDLKQRPFSIATYIPFEIFANEQSSLGITDHSFNLNLGDLLREFFQNQAESSLGGNIEHLAAQLVAAVNLSEEGAYGCLALIQEGCSSDDETEVPCTVTACLDAVEALKSSFLAGWNFLQKVGKDFNLTGQIQIQDTSGDGYIDVFGGPMGSEDSWFDGQFFFENNEKLELRLEILTSSSKIE